MRTFAFSSNVRGGSAGRLRLAIAFNAIVMLAVMIATLVAPSVTAATSA